MSAHARGYDWTWRKLRIMHLAREPLCRFCWFEGITTPADEVDHIIPIRERPDLRLDPNNLRSLCQPCHAAHSARQAAAERALPP